ncbi:hypothetical protein [Mycobacterium sp.]|uniref:hypothetical protein n=1 Tax=Mycobacterium sp. TaxID=1785 RepID=UPI002BC42CD2|nr:hypothetical protein [Mycobacterium sp.]HME47949.1 hypothetical protein [Mycobacterium sp.]
MTARRAGLAVRLIAAAALTLVGAVTPEAAAGEPGDVPFLQVRVDRVTPEIVTTGSEATVTVAGTVTNVGDRPVHDIVVRLERAAAVTSSAGLRTNLDGRKDQYQAVGAFVSVVPELDQGQAGAFTLTYPLRSQAEPSLGIDQPGVYPLLVNVNGTPDYGDAARLDDARFLLPVLGVPPDTAAQPAGALNGVVAPDTSRPVQITMLWPLADRPRLAAGGAGGVTPVRLTDDELAASLAPGGRLDTLLSSADFATGSAVDPGGDMTKALCLAVDPDLLVTVNAMAGGYVVADNPADRNSPTHPGAGQAAAAAWLDRLRALARRMCVAPVNYAQADLDALHRIGDPGLSGIATNGAGDIVDNILGVTSTRGATLLGDGPLTLAAADLLTAEGDTVAIAAAACSAQDSASKPETANVTPRRLSPQLVTAPFDPTVGAALAAAGSAPTSPSYLDRTLTVPLEHDSATARRQDALSAMLWLGLNPDTAPRTQIVMPPLMWDLQPTDAQSFMTTLATSIHAGLTVARPLTAVIADARGTAAPGPVPSPADGDATPGRIDDSVTADIAGNVGRLWGLTAALTTDERTGMTGTQYTAPLREDMLRALSQSEPPDTRNGLAGARLAAVDTTINDMFGAVTVVNPGGSYTLATEHSPLPLALRNNLAVPIRVRLQVDTPPGMTVTDMGVIELPPGYLPLRVPVEVHFTHRVAVDAGLRTPDGLPLGESVRLSVHSNAYGQVLFFITLTAAAVLVLLTGRRLWHRFRGQPDPADLDRPEPE